MIVDLTCLGLSRESQAAFCLKRIREQYDYINSLTSHPCQIELQESARSVKNAFTEKLHELIKKEEYGGR